LWPVFLWALLFGLQLRGEHYCRTEFRDERYCGQGFQNGRKLAIISGRLRNSTIFAAQKSGLGQSSPKSPGHDGKLKQRPDCSGTPARNSALWLFCNFDPTDL
jgi:hypothetical protein